MRYFHWMGTLHISVIKRKNKPPSKPGRKLFRVPQKLLGSLNQEIKAARAAYFSARTRNLLGPKRFPFSHLKTCSSFCGGRIWRVNLCYNSCPRDYYLGPQVFSDIYWSVKGGWEKGSLNSIMVSVQEGLQAGPEYIRAECPSPWRNTEACFICTIEFSGLSLSLPTSLSFFLNGGGILAQLSI